MRLTARKLAFGVVVALAAGSIPASRAQDQVQVGYTVLTPDSGSVAPVGAAVFSYTDPDGTLVSQAGVGAATPTKNGRIFVDQSGTTQTGIALVNTASIPATAMLTLRDATGSIVGSTLVQPLKANEHISSFVSEMFGASAAGVRGSLTFVSDQPLAAIAIRQSTNAYGEPLYATLPVSDLTAASSSTPLVFPQIAAGQGYTTQLVLVNTTSATITGHVRLAGDAGTPLPLAVNGTVGSDVVYLLPPQGTYLAEVSSTAALAVGSATVTPNTGNAAPTGTAIFRYGSSAGLLTEAAASATATTSARMFVDYLGTQTGVAIANPGTAGTAVTFNLMDRFGNLIETTSQNVAAGGHLALFVNQLFPDLVAPFSGLLDIESVTPIAPMTLKLTTNLRGDLVLTTLPVADLTAPSSNASVIFPQMVLGGGWSTQLILINPNLTKAATGKLSFLDSNGSPITTSMSGQTSSQFAYQFSSGSGRRFIPGNPAGVASATAVDPATGKVTSEVTVNVGNTVALPLQILDSNGAVRDDFDATIVSSNSAVAAVTSGSVSGKQAGFSTLDITVGGDALAITATVVDVQTGPTGFQPTGIVEDLAQRIYLSSSDNTIRLEQDITTTPTTYAGISHAPGLKNDLRLQSQFNSPAFLALNQSDGSLFVCDSGNNVIRRIHPGTSGRVDTFAGSGTAGSADGPLLQASFDHPQGIALDGRGGLWVIDSGNHTIRLIDLTTSTVQTIAGQAGVPGFADGTGSVALFQSPVGIAVEAESLAQQLVRQQTGAAPSPVSLIVADTGNGAVRRVSATGLVQTIAGAAPASDARRRVAARDSGAGAFPSATGVAVDGAGNIYVSQPQTGQVQVILNNGSVVPAAQSKTLLNPMAVAVSANGKIDITTSGGAQQNSFGGPQISTVQPNEIALGSTQTITLQGHNFSTDSIVVVGGVVVKQPLIVSTETITFQAPTVLSGRVAVSVENRAGIGQAALLVDSLPLSALAKGFITTVAGGSSYSGEGLPATAASFNHPASVVQDSSGNLLVADTSNNKIRRIDVQTNIITTIAGTGIQGNSGVGQPAIAAQLGIPSNIAVDAAGNVIIPTGSDVRKVDSNTGLLTIIAGNESYSSSGNGLTALNAGLPAVAVAFDAAGNLYTHDLNNPSSVASIHRIDAQTGIVTTLAGNGIASFSGDGGPATAASLSGAGGLTLDGTGNLYFADGNNRRVRKVDGHTGIISTIAGGGTSGKDGVLGTSEMLTQPNGVAADPSGNVFIADNGNNKVYRVDAVTGIITTVAGNASGQNGTSAGYSGDGGPATAAKLSAPSGVWLNAAGEVLIADTANNVIRKVDTNGIISTIAGVGVANGDNGPATAAALSHPNRVAFDGVGNFYISDSEAASIRKVDLKGTITTIAGSTQSVPCLQDDNGPATAAHFYQLGSIAFDASNNLYFAEANAGRIRRIDAKTQIITTVAGSCGVGSAGNSFGGDNGPATSAGLNYPFGLVFDPSGNLYIADEKNNRIRRIDAKTQIITTVAGNGTAGFSGDGGPAISAALNQPWDIAFDSTGNLYIADNLNNRIRMVDTTGKITTVAGGGTLGVVLINGVPSPDGTDTGNGSLATSAGVPNPSGVRVDAAGNIFISEQFGGLRFVDATTKVINAIGGNVNFISGIFSGDGGPVSAAKFFWPAGFTFDSAGNLFVADTGNRRIRAIRGPLP